jgi:hypothetical protein
MPIKWHGRPAAACLTTRHCSRRRHGALAFAPAAAGPAPVGWREKREIGPFEYSKFHLCGWGRPAPAAGIFRGRSEPVKAVGDRRATASVELPGERTREDDLDRTCPAQELAAIGSRDTSSLGLIIKCQIVTQVMDEPAAKPCRTCSARGEALLGQQC